MADRKEKASAIAKSAATKDNWLIALISVSSYMKCLIYGSCSTATDKTTLLSSVGIVTDMVSQKPANAPFGGA